MRRLDHSMIFVLIAGTYTPVCLLALHGALANTILIVVWAGALGGVIFKLVWIDAPKWLFALVYVALGWVSAAIFGELPAAIGWLGVAGLAAGGLLYTIGAVVYASGRPNPWPRSVRLPRGLPRARARRRRAALRGDRVRRAAAAPLSARQTNSPRLGHIRASAQSPQAGRRAWQVRRPWRSRLTCSSSSSPGRRQREHLVVQLLERRALAQQGEPPADARDVRVDGHVVQAVGEQQHARRRLAPDARQRDEVVARLARAARAAASPARAACGGSRAGPR